MNSQKLIGCSGHNKDLKYAFKENCLLLTPFENDYLRAQQLEQSQKNLRNIISPTASAYLESIRDGEIRNG